jgi:hypothetical protein
MQKDKERLLGCWWEGGGKSGFVGRITHPDIHTPHSDDEYRAWRLATTWALWARYFARG